LTGNNYIKTKSRKKRSPEGRGKKRASYKKGGKKKAIKKRRGPGRKLLWEDPKKKACKSN